MNKDRKYLRVKLASEVILHNGISPEPARAVNISLGGIYVISRYARPKGAEVELDFMLPPNQRIRAKGVVVRATQHADEKYPVGMGIQFLNLPVEGRAEIDHYVRRVCRLLRALFFELNRAKINESKVFELATMSPIQYQYPLDILREKVTMELSYLRLRAGRSYRK
jgi:uncharacterized protein (TIGR02266 family)